MRSIFKNWGKKGQQTVRRDPEQGKSASYYVRQGDHTIEVRPCDLDSLIAALICVRIRTTGRRS